MIRKTASFSLLVAFAAFVAFATSPATAQRFNDDRPQAPVPIAGALNNKIGADNDRLKVSTYPGVLPTLRLASATNAINTQTTLTIPTPPPGQFNYVCSLSFTAAQDATATAIANSVTTATNIAGSAFALQFSAEDVAHKVYVQTMHFGSPQTGCVKSDLPSVATTFVSPAAVANASFAWQATYYQN